MGRYSLWVLLGLTLFAVTINDVFVSAEVGPTETECRPYIEKAINELKTGDASDIDAQSGDGTESAEDTGEAKSGEDEQADSKEVDATLETIEVTDGDSAEGANEPKSEEEAQSGEGEADEAARSGEEPADETQSEEQADEGKSEEQGEDAKSEEGQAEDDGKSGEDQADDAQSGEEQADEAKSGEELDEAKSTEDDDTKSGEEEAENTQSAEEQTEEAKSGEDQTESGEAEATDAAEDDVKSEEESETEPAESSAEDTQTASEETDDQAKSAEEGEGDNAESAEADEASEEAGRSKRSVGEEEEDAASQEQEDKPASEEATEETEESKEQAAEGADDAEESKEEADAAVEESKEEAEKDSKEDEPVADDTDSKEADTSAEAAQGEEDEAAESGEAGKEDETSGEATESDEEKKEESEEETRPEDELLWEGEIPENRRDRKHINELLHLDDEYEERERATDRVAEIVLRDVKRIYENAVKPLETIYKYRDLSNRHFSDPEIFSKPLVLFMGPWSGGKSSIINYLTDNEYKPHSLRSGAEPSPAYFNILMWGNETEVLDGNQLAADYTFSGLQKFGQGLEDRLRGLKMPSKLLEKVNIVEIPGILEVRKTVSRHFPFNDACQWFIDRADIIFLVYDPAKLDVGPESEAILDQLKGREYQTRIVLNKADTVHPEELLRVQGALIWNISPLMSSAQPPVMYTTSLWSHPYEIGSPVRLLQAQERAFLRDLRSAVEKRIENKIASARRFAVRVRNHAKMVDCYLNTYYNHKTLFGNKKRISDEIVDHPQNYHIYEGLSTLTNISRYDLPDPEVYRDFFRLNPLYEFKKLSETCTYFRGCPINKLDVAIAYDLPELTGKYKKMAEAALNKIESAHAATGSDAHKSRS